MAGKLLTRRWKKDEEDADRFSTEILLAPGGRVQFLDKSNGNGAAVSGSGDGVRRGCGGRPSVLRLWRAGAGASCVGPC